MSNTPREKLPANAEKMQVKGRFQKGQSGNPKGKVNGTKNRATLAAEQLLQGELDNICRKLIEEAVSGNMQVVKMILDHVLPIRRDSKVKLDIPVLHTPEDAIQSMALITQAVMRGRFLQEKQNLCQK